MKSNRPYCLSLAGFDPSAGAGILADIKTFEMLDVYGLGVITSDTVQTDRVFIEADWVSFEKIKYRLRALFDMYLINYAKIGLVKDFDTLKNIILFLKENNETVTIVWDPVLKSSAGRMFHDKGDMDICFPENECTLITPNWN
jgi:hydroxymethylpyrimidine/phosphomethylpyrimidine kinase